MTDSAPRSIDQYLRALRAALADADPALVQDALYDAEEYLRAEVASHPERSEADVLELIASTYGAPEEVAQAYRTSEAQVRVALAPPAPRPRRTALGRFFAVYTDSRAWTALFYLVLTLATGIVYFTVAVTGLALSAGLAVLIVGVPFFLLFVGLTRILALAEGRLVEGLLGVRMPRRGRYATGGASLAARIREMLLDRRTWTTLLYFVLMLPLGIGYFVFSVVGCTVALALLAAPIALLLATLGLPSADLVLGTQIVTAPLAIPCALLGALLLTVLMHAARGLGEVHGALAKALLVAPRAD